MKSIINNLERKYTPDIYNEDQNDGNKYYNYNNSL